MCLDSYQSMFVPLVAMGQNQINFVIPTIGNLHQFKMVVNTEWYPVERQGCTDDQRDEDPEIGVHDQPEKVHLESDPKNRTLFC